MWKTLVFHAFRGVKSPKLKSSQFLKPSSTFSITKHFHENHQNKDKNLQNYGKLVLGASIWSILSGKGDEVEETPEDKLIMNIKRGILSIQKGDYKGAERMLHIALKMAQDLQHSEGITYIYDVRCLSLSHYQCSNRVFFLDFSKFGSWGWWLW